MEPIILTKNSLSQLDVFFWKSNFQNIHRPNISHLKIDSYKESKQAFHIGFKEAMGFLDSYEICTGLMVFEVLEGYPLQSLLIYNNENAKLGDSLKFSLTDLEPMDFFCINEHGDDPYGDFVLKNVKFYSTELNQGIDSPGRKIIARFVCSGKKAFKIPYFYNNFISDNYSHHIVRGKTEINQIIKDIVKFNGQFVDEESLNNILTKRFKDSLNINYQEENDSIENLLIKKWKIFEKKYAQTYQNQLAYYSEIKDIRDFINVFYEWKNKYELEKIKNTTRLRELLKYFKGGTENG